MTIMDVPGADRIIAPIVLPDHEMAIGLLFVHGAGYRVATVAQGEMRHMSAAAAARMARDLQADDNFAAYGPVIGALNDAAKVAGYVSQAEREGVN